MRTDRKRVARDRRRRAGQASVEAILILPFLLTFVILAREAGKISLLQQDLIVSSRTNAFDLALNQRCRLTLDQMQRSWFPVSCKTDGADGKRFLDDMQKAADNGLLEKVGGALDLISNGPSGITRPLRNVEGPAVTEATMKAPFPWLGNTVPRFMQPDQPPVGVMVLEAKTQVSANRVWVSADDRSMWRDRARLANGYDAVLREKLDKGPWELRRTDRFFKHLFPSLGRP